MHREILTEKQIELLPLIKNFSENFGLVGGTAIALGRRAKWKDYVDIYFILKNHHNIGEITKKAREIFSSEFNEKIFRTQLAYFKDIDYTEKVIYREGFEVNDEIIRNNLVYFSLSMVK